MKIFQIWIENPSKPDNKMMGWMQTVLDKMPNESEYALISTNNYFPKNKKVQWIDVNTTIAELPKSKPEIKQYFSTLPSQLQSDCLRYYLTSQYDNSIYFDCDVEIVKWPDPINEKDAGLYFCPLNKENDKIIDGHAFWVAGAKDEMGIFFSQLIHEMIKKILSGGKIEYAFTFNFLNKYFKSNKLFKLDANYFNHHK